MDHAPSAPRAPDTDADSPSFFDLRHSLRARATLVFGGGALVFTLLLGSIAGAMLHHQLEHQLGPSYENLAAQVNDKLDRRIYERLRELQFAASLAPLRSAATPANERRAALESLFSTSVDYAWIGFADATGTVTTASQGLFERTNVSTRTWFRGARTLPYAGEVHEFAELTRARPEAIEDHPRFLDLAVPVTDADGKILGVLAAHLRWSLARDVQSSVVPETARREHLGVTIYAEGGEVLEDSNASGWTESPPAPSVPGGLRARGFLQESVGGDGNYLAGYARSRAHPNFRGLAWLVIVRQPARDAFAPVAELQRRIAWIGGSLAAFVALATWFVTSRLTRRLRAIATAADRIRTGDVLTLIPRPPGHSEMAGMCGALDAMVETLRQQKSKLEADNTLLTARLYPPTDAEREQARKQRF